MSSTAAAPRLAVDASLRAQLPAAIATAAIAPPLAWLLWLSGSVSPAAALGAMALFVFVVVSAGCLLLRAAGAGDMPAPAAWTLGIFASALAVYGLCTLLAWTAASAFALWSVAVVLAALGWHGDPSPRRPGAAELVGLLACGVATLMWCGHAAGAAQRAARGEPLFAWVDFLIHAGVISQFGDPLAAGRGSIELVDFPLLPYHYASYALAAAFAVPLDLPGLPLSSALWLPLGFFTLCAGAYALGDSLAGRAGGIAALGALALVPDPASYGLQGFHWTMLALPGSTYAVGICLLAIAFLRRWSPGGRWSPAIAAGILVAGTVFFRIHVFALALPSMLVIAAMALPVVQRRKLVFACAGLAALAAFVVAFYALVPNAVPAMEIALDALLSDQLGPTAFAMSYGRLAASHGQAFATAAGLLVWLAACLGVLAVLYPLSAWLVRRVRGPQGPEVEPAAFFACYLLLLAAAPKPFHGDATELTQRPYVLLYAVIAIWTACNLVRALAGGEAPDARRPWLALLAAGGLASCLLWSHARTLGSEPRFKWGWQYYALRFEEGLPQAADFLRANARPGDVFAARDVTFAWGASDVATDVIALTAMPAYLSRAFTHGTLGGDREQTVRRRYAALARVAREDEAAAAARRLRELGIRWYVVTGGYGPRWDPQLRRAAFVSGKVAVYSSEAP
jgi:hypothetical protein